MIYWSEFFLPSPLLSSLSFFTITIIIVIVVLSFSIIVNRAAYRVLSLSYISIVA